MSEILTHSFFIAAFVFSMMIIIEFFNIQTKGSLQKRLHQNTTSKFSLATFLGLIPGCFGSFTMVTLYTHSMVSIGALLTTSIITLGDIGFLFLILNPIKATVTLLLLVFVGLIFGSIFERYTPKKKLKVDQCDDLVIHDHQDFKTLFSWKQFQSNFKNCSPVRGLLVIFILFFLSFIYIKGDHLHLHHIQSTYETPGNKEKIVPDKSHDHHDHNHSHHSHSTTNGATSSENTDQIFSDFLDDPHHQFQDKWVAFTLVFLLVFALSIISLVSDHFLADHLWGHVVKKHMPKTFFWILISLILLEFFRSHIEPSFFQERSIYTLILFSLLLGLIPDSAPSLLILALYLTGKLPFSVFIAHAIVQEGHGLLPLLAQSKRSFILIKFIKFIIGGAIASLLFSFGW